MTILNVTFDTASFDRDIYRKIASGGVLMSVSGLINLKWEEFSALDIARELNFHEVVWDAVWDDTPGTLTCIFFCRTLALEPLLGLSVLEWHTDD